MSQPVDNPPPRRRRPLVRLLIMLLGAIFLLTPPAAGAALYLLIDGRLPIDRADSTVDQAPDRSTADGLQQGAGRRLNVLLLGSDHRQSDHTDFGRTDTMIVLTLDAAAHTAGMLSLPRDLWVSIPGHGNERINAAYGLGEAAKTGSGPELARRTVEQLLGVPIHHYVLVGFEGFEQLITQAGGVTLDVERPMRDDEYPEGDFGTRRIFFQPGLQHLDGETALWYVRSRHADSDFGRARRQQQLLVALRAQALQLDLVPKLPTLWKTVAKSIQTDLRWPEIVRLAGQLKQVDSGAMTNRVVDETMTRHWVTPGGAQVEIADQAALKALVQALFLPAPAGPP